MKERFYFVRGQHIATGEAVWVYNHTELNPPRSYAYCCPHCGEVWAQAVVERAKWLFLTSPCERCPNGLYPAGSLWLPFHVEYMESWPLAVWQREAALWLNRDVPKTERKAA